MQAVFTSLLALAFTGLFVGWAMLERRKSSPRLWLGFVATAIAVPLAFYAGVFVSSFSDNLCYSEAIMELQSAHAAGRAVKIELHGYETNCTDLLASLRRR